MNKILVVIDMQDDFITGSLGSCAAQRVVPAVCDRIKEFKDLGQMVICTKDTHYSNYMETQEGRNLPVRHCTKNTPGWQLNADVKAALPENVSIFEKGTFGSVALAERLVEINKEAPIDELEVVGLVSSICVVTNALLFKAFLPELPITINRDCTAGVTEEDNDAALKVMAMCQIKVT